MKKLLMLAGVASGLVVPATASAGWRQELAAERAVASAIAKKTEYPKAKWTSEVVCLQRGVALFACGFTSEAKGCDYYVAGQAVVRQRERKRYVKLAIKYEDYPQPELGSKFPDVSVDTSGLEAAMERLMEQRKQDGC
jgi:hypothetical protein